MKPTSPSSNEEPGKRRFSRAKRGDDPAPTSSRKPRQRPRLAVTVRDGLDLQVDAPLHVEGAWAIEPLSIEPAEQGSLLEIDFTQPWEVSDAALDVESAVAEARTPAAGVWELLESAAAETEADHAPTSASDPEPEATVEWVDDQDQTPSHVTATSPVRRRTKATVNKAEDIAASASPRADSTDQAPPEQVAKQDLEPDGARHEIDLAISRARIEAERAEAARAEAQAARAEAEKLKKQARLARVQAQQIKLAKAEADAAREEAERLRSEAEVARRELDLLRSQSKEALDAKAAAEAERLRADAAAAQHHAEQAGHALDEAAAAKHEAERLRAEADAAREQAAEAKRVAAEVVKAAKAEAAKARALARAEAKAAAQAARAEAVRAKAAVEEERAAAAQAKAEADKAKAEADQALAAAEAVVAQAARAAAANPVLDQPGRSRRRRGRVSSRARLSTAAPIGLTQIDTSRFEPVASTPSDGPEAEWPSIGNADVADTPASPGPPSSHEDHRETAKTATYRASRAQVVSVPPDDRFRPYQAAFRPEASPEPATTQ